MKRVLTVLILAAAVLMTVCSCGGDVKVTLDEAKRTESENNSSSWSVLIYMCGDSGGKASEAIKELCSFKYPQNVNIAVQTGGSSEWDIDGINADYLQRYVMQKGSMFLKDQKQSASMGDYETLRDFMSWGLETFNTDKYMLIIMGDSDGTEIFNDSLYNNDSLTIEELSYAVSLTGHKFDIIGFDGSYTASFETAAALSTYADFMIASEERSIGWDYGYLADCLIRYPYVEPLELGQIICDSYYEKCIDEDYEAMASMSFTDLSQVSYIAQAFDGMAGMMLSATDSLDDYGALSRNMLGAQNCVGSDSMVDLVSMAYSIAANAGDSAQSVIDAVSRAVVSKVNGTLRLNAGGLSVYYPKHLDEEKLNLYMKTTVSDNYKNFIKCIAPGMNVVDDYVSGGYEESWAWCDYVGREFSCGSYISDDSRYSLRIAGDMNIVKDVRLKKYYFNSGANAYLSMGADNNLDCDWAGQTYMDNVTMQSIKLNGKIVQADMVDEIRDVGKIYEIPIMVNNKMGSVTVFYSWAEGKYEILGAWIEGSRYEPEFGDTIVPLHEVLDESETILTGDSFRIGIGGLKISNASLPNGSYKLQYNLEDIYFKLRTADPAVIEKSGKEIKIYQ